MINGVRKAITSYEKELNKFVSTLNHSHSKWLGELSVFYSDKLTIQNLTQSSNLELLNIRRQFDEYEIVT